MFIRSKIVDGQTYHALVRGVREGGRVRQEVVVALGRHATIAAAIKAERRELARLKRERERLPGDASTYAGRLRRKVDALDRMLARSEAKIGILEANRSADTKGDQG